MPWLLLGLLAGGGVAWAALSTPPPSPPLTDAERLRNAQRDVLTAVNVILQQMAQQRCADRATVAMMQSLANKHFALFLSVNAAELAKSPEGVALLNTPPMRTDGLADAGTLAAFHTLTGATLVACGS